MADANLTITVLFNNVEADPTLQTAHGLACLIEGSDRTILFDTGCDGTLLLENMAKLGKDPAAVDTVVISHMHWDHVGGLYQFLRVNSDVTVFLPSSASKNFRLHAEWLGARTRIADDPMEIARGILSTGTMERPGTPKEMHEQSLLIDSVDGTVVFTGCAHPGIVAITERAAELKGPKLAAVLGGFHLVDASAAEIDSVAEAFRRLGVARVGASHCTGSPATAAFEAAWPGNFTLLGCGTIHPIAC